MMKHTQSLSIACYNYTNVCGPARSIHRRKNIYRQKSSDAETGDRSHRLYFMSPVPWKFLSSDRSCAS